MVKVFAVKTFFPTVETNSELPEFRLSYWKSAAQIHLRFPRAAAEPPCANALRSLT